MRFQALLLMFRIRPACARLQRCPNSRCWYLKTNNAALVSTCDPYFVFTITRNVIGLAPSHPSGCHAGGSSLTPCRVTQLRMLARSLV